MLVLDSGNVAMLTLFDLSSALDIARIVSRSCGVYTTGVIYGLEGTVPGWFESCLRCRVGLQQVRSTVFSSTPFELLYTEEVRYTADLC